VTGSNILIISFLQIDKETYCVYGKTKLLGGTSTYAKTILEDHC
jgi:hypothetical protein